MPDEYLWVSKGQPDPEVARLEAMLSRFRSASHAGATMPGNTASRQRQLCSCAAAIRCSAHRQATVLGVCGPCVAGLCGTGNESGNAKVQLEAEFIGSVEMEPGSRMRVTASKPDRQVLDLQLWDDACVNLGATVAICGRDSLGAFNTISVVRITLTTDATDGDC